MEELVQDYRDEVNKLLEEVRASLGKLQQQPVDPDVVGSISCDLHTLKGCSVHMRYENIVRLLHEMEAVFQLLRYMKIQMTDGLIDLAYTVCEVIQVMAYDFDGFDYVPLNIYEDLLDAIRKAAVPSGDMAIPPGDVISIESSQTTRSSPFHTYRIRMKPTFEGLRKGQSPLPVLRKLRDLGDLRLTCHGGVAFSSERQHPGAAYACWDLVLSVPEGPGENAIRSAFEPIQENCGLTIDLIDDDSTPWTESSYKLLGEILAERGDIKPELIEEVVQSQKYIGEMLVEAGLVGPTVVESALIEQNYVREIRDKRRKRETLKYLKVPIDGLDNLIGGIDELHSAQRRLLEAQPFHDAPQYHHLLSDLESKISSIRDAVLSLRKVTLGEAFGYLKSVIGDLASRLGKEVELVFHNEDLEIDRPVADPLREPLLHLIRNSVDHGIEKPELRERLGKNRKGQICLSAQYCDSRLLIELCDDGKGLDHERIRAHAEETGLVSRGAAIDDDKIVEFILRPGFSTAGTTSEISGRGIGMEVLKRAVDSMNGSIVISSKRNEWTKVAIHLGPQAVRHEKRE